MPTAWRRALEPTSGGKRGGAETPGAGETRRLAAFHPVKVRADDGEPLALGGLLVHGERGRGNDHLPVPAVAPRMDCLCPSARLLALLLDRLLGASVARLSACSFASLLPCSLVSFRARGRGPALTCMVVRCAAVFVFRWGQVGKSGKA